MTNSLDSDWTNVLSVLILVQTVCKGYQQMTLVSKELIMKFGTITTDTAIKYTCPAAIGNILLKTESIQISWLLMTLSDQHPYFFFDAAFDSTAENVFREYLCDMKWLWMSFIQSHNSCQ